MKYTVNSFNVIYLFKFLTLTVKSSPERPPSTDDHDPHDPNYALGYYLCEKQRISGVGQWIGQGKA